VAVKLMREREHFLHELEPRLKNALSRDHVVDVLRVHIDLGVVGAKEIADELSAMAKENDRVLEFQCNAAFGTMGEVDGGGEPYK